MFLQQFINGLSMGIMYALMAIGYSMVFGVLSFINFAHGSISMVGAYMTWYLLMIIDVGYPIAIIGGLLTAMFLGMIIEKVGYLPLRKAPRLSLLVVSLGFSFILDISVQLIWGTEAQYMPPMIPINNYYIMNAKFNSLQIAVLFISFILMVLLYLLIQKTKIGIVFRAVALDKDTCGLMGINVNNVISLLFATGSIIGAISAIMVAVYYNSVYSTLGVSIGMKGFTAVILGGIGSIPGAVMGGIIIGILESLGGAYIATAYKDGIAFILLIIILLIRPAGLLGKEIEKEG